MSPILSCDDIIHPDALEKPRFKIYGRIFVPMNYSAYIELSKRGYYLALRIERNRKV